MSENENTDKKLDEILDMLENIGKSMKINSNNHGNQLNRIEGLLIEIRDHLKGE